MIAELLILQMVTATWSPDVSTDNVTNYLLSYGVSSGVYSTTIDAGTSTSVNISGLVTGTKYYFTVAAKNASGVSANAPEVVFVMPQTVDPNCVFPTGADSVSIFPTLLSKTGSGAAGSKARMDFQLSSPGSPVTSVEIKGNEAVLQSMTGTALDSLAGMWFSLPVVSGSYNITISAANQYGCTNEVQTNQTVVIP